MLSLGQPSKSLSIVLDGQIENWVPVPKSALCVIFSELQKFVDNDYPNLHYESDTAVTLSEIIKKVKKILLQYKKSQVKFEY